MCRLAVMGQVELTRMDRHRVQWPGSRGGTAYLRTRDEDHLVVFALDEPLHLLHDFDPARRLSCDRCAVAGKQSGSDRPRAAINLAEDQPRESRDRAGMHPEPLALRLRTKHRVDRGGIVPVGIKWLVALIVQVPRAQQHEPGRKREAKLNDVPQP